MTHRPPTYEELLDRVGELELDASRWQTAEDLIRNLWTTPKENPGEEDAGVPGVADLIQELARHKHLAETAKKRENTLRKYISCISDVITVMDRDGFIRYKSPNVLLQFGWRPEEMIGRHCLDTVNQKDKDRVENELNRLLDSPGERVCVEYDYVCKDGSCRPIELTAVNLLKDSEVSGVLANYKDISERKKANETLRRSEDKYRTLIERSNDMIWTLDESGSFTFFNKQVEETTGLKLEEWKGRSFAPLVLKEELPFLMEVLTRSLEGESQNYEMTFPHPKRGKLTFSVNTAPIFHEDAVVGIVSFGRDITQQKNAEKQKAILEAQLWQSQKMEAVGTLAGGIAHSFNNILGAILGFAELAQTTAENNKTTDHLDEIESAAKRARALVSQILTFSRKSEPDLKPIDFNYLLTQSVNLLRYTLPKSIGIQIETSAALDCIDGDSIQLEQVIVNLASNAADAMPDGGRLNFSLSSVTFGRESAPPIAEMAPGTYLLLTVADSGHGIPAEVVNKIFDPFFTTKEIGKGTGLGLSTAFGTIRNHGGHILYVSGPDEGTTFEIYLPSRPCAEKKIDRNALGSHLNRSGNERILLVDDEPALRDLGTEVLSSYGYRVICAASGEEALERYREADDDVDLVILDLGMPGMGGEKCHHELRAINPDLKVLVVSGYSSNIGDPSTPGPEPAGYLSKPFTISELTEAVRDALEG